MGVETNFASTLTDWERLRVTRLAKIIATTALLLHLCCLPYSTIQAWSSHRLEYYTKKHQQQWNHCDGRQRSVCCISETDGSESDATNNDSEKIDSQGSSSKSTYNLGTGKNPPVGSSNTNSTLAAIEQTIYAGALESLMGSDTTGKLKWKLPRPTADQKNSIPGNGNASNNKDRPRRIRRMVARSQESSILRGAIWHEEHYSNDGEDDSEGTFVSTSSGYDDEPFPRPQAFYPNIDLSIPSSVFDSENGIDVVWDLMRWEAYQEAQREPLLVSFLYSSILNHDTLESSLAFLLANKLSGTMISTQINSLIMEALNNDPSIGRAIRADIMAVRDRDPACTCLPDVFLYFKGFHALQTYRVAHAIWKVNKKVLAHYLQSQMSHTFQIDIHPNATLGSGIMLDHGTGIVIGETARVGHNVSILHHVTLGGSGKKGVDRHPKVGDGVLIGAGASILGNVEIGEGVQVGAGGLVITDLPPHVVAVGVPVKIIGRFVDVTEQPSIKMNQMMDAGMKNIDMFLSDGI
ncbi:serine O-acetyltransferase [Nitzschia inconspicua]|uniref:serine O-acetyltransferase n=1 Tax=Nitzschia inconspicua TaxID=303405 RepID=A0A9K3KG93_9STRA|nr:serine O-acetyltransferase [Nitzschia inconspicua]